MTTDTAGPDEEDDEEADLDDVAGGESAVTIDTHIHLAGTGCGHSGCHVSPGFRKRYTFRMIKYLLGISDQILDTDIDQRWPDIVAQYLRDSCINYGVVLGFDGIVGSNGDLDREKSQLIVPADWVFHVCKEHKNLLPGPSVNPFRRDAIQTLKYCIDQGAVLIKWLPSVQLIDPQDTSLREFYGILKDANIPLLIHCGGERTFHSTNPELNRMENLFAPLESGVKVICAHSGSAASLMEKDKTHVLKRLLSRYPNLWVDNSGLCNPARYRSVPRLAKDRQINARTLYGSDWPVPSNAFYYLARLGLGKVRALEREKNPFTRDVETKRALGYPDRTLTRAHRVLANLDRWIHRT